ncbi:MAG: cell division FtsZ family protein [Malacoplasma sp.]|nr:cell division FtsZ family protein [Malacoplasma sp.]MDE5774797.1 cell division FtsZ family protein [Malacoplasma sp.]
MANNKTVVDRILDSVDANDYMKKRKTTFNKENYLLNNDENDYHSRREEQPRRESIRAEQNTTPLIIKKEDQYYFGDNNSVSRKSQEERVNQNLPTVNPQQNQIVRTQSSLDNSKIKIKKEMNTLQDINNSTLVHLLSNREKTFSKSFSVKIIGVGGAGNNIVKYMVNSQEWPDFCDIIALNTDYVALSNLGENLRNIFILGAEELNGNGSGGNPDTGKRAAEADIEVLKTMLEGTDVLILVAGLGKGTGTGATPIIAKAAQDLGILTIGLFNLPSIGAEGEKTYSNALLGLQNLAYCCNGLTTVNNDKIINVDKEKMSIKRAYESANKYIKTIVEEIINIITVPSDINVDFADVRNFFEDKNGFLFMRITATDYTKDGIKDAIETGIKTGFSDINIKNSEKALINFKLNENVPSYVLENTRSALKEIVESGNVNIVHGVAYNDVFEDAEINVLLTGTFELSDIEDVQPKLPSEDKESASSSSSSTSSIYDTLKEMENNKSELPSWTDTYESKSIQSSYPSTTKILGIQDEDTEEVPFNNSARRENPGRYSQEYGSPRYNQYNRPRYYDDYEEDENYYGSRRSKKKKRSLFDRIFRRNR